MRPILLLCAFLIAANAHAMGKKPSDPTPLPSPAPSPTRTIDLDPDTLRQYVLAGNDSITDELYQVYTAKDTRDAALGKLLPTLNLSAIVGAASGPSFAVSSISFLLPFLVPDNWINLQTAQDQLNAEEESYLILELNTYASAYALYETVVGDYEILNALTSNYQTLNNLYLTLQADNQVSGSVAVTDVNTALEKALQAKGQVVDMQRVIALDVTALREAMGLGLETELTFSKLVHVQANPTLERETAAQVTDAAINQGVPEAEQLNDILAAARDSRWSAIFGFLGSYTLAPSNDKASGLASLQGAQGASIGFDYASNIQIAQDNIDLVKEQIEDVSRTLQSESDSTLQSIAGFEEELQLFTQAAATSQEVYFSKLNNYNNGTDTLLDVLQQQSDYFTQTIQSLQARQNLDQERIALNRILLLDQFSAKNIHGCAPQSVSLSGGDSGPFGWVSDLFHPSAGRVTLDQLCKAAAPADGSPSAAN